MAYKLSLMLSFLFLMFVFLTAGDLVCVSHINSGLNNLAVTIGYRIAKEGQISEQTETLVSDYGASIRLPYAASFRIGESVTFVLSKEYKPLIMSKNTMVISVKHVAIVGYYDSYF